MATITSKVTVGAVLIVTTATDPSAGGGTVAPIGSLALLTGGSTPYYKTGAAATDWSSLNLLSFPIGPQFGGTGIANNALSTITITGNFATTFTVTAITSVTLPTSGTLYGTKTNSITSAQLYNSLSNPTGTGLAVFNDTPTLIAPLLGTPTSGNLANCTGFPASGITGILGPANGGTGIANNAASTWSISGNFATTVTVTAITTVTLPTTGTLYGTKTGSISSAQLLNSVSDPSGTGAVIFGTSPVFVTQITTPVIYGSSAVSGTLLIDSTSNGTKGPITFGTASSSNSYLFNVGSSTSLITLMGRVGATTNATMYLAVASASETNTNYCLSWDGTLRINSQTTTSTINMTCGNTGVFSITPIGTGSASFFTFAVRARATLATTVQSCVFDVTGSIQTWAAGTVASQYFSYFRSQTMAFASASTTTLVAGVAVEHVTVGANATFTTAAALYVPTATYTATTTAYSAYFIAPSGATNNWALGTSGNVNMLAIGTNGISYQGLVGTTTTSAIYLNQTTPSATNFSLSGTAAGSTVINGSGNVIVQFAGTNRIIANSGGLNMSGGQGVAGISIFQLTASNTSNQTASTNVPKFLFTISTMQWATGALAQGDFVQWTQPTISFVGASTATLVSTIAINGAPIASTNSTVTTSVGLLIASGTSLNGTSAPTDGYAALFNAPTGATNNYALGLAGDLNFTVNASKIIAVGTGANGLILKNLKNSANTTVSGVVKTVEIDIAGTPYYFLVSPTSSA